MRKVAISILLAAALFAVLAMQLSKASRQSIGEAQASQSDGGPRVPVLVELFTSEGCSSCPPADELLARLEKTQPVGGAEVIALSEHVDYWNHLGWRDPYSSAKFSERQNEYARAFRSDDVYTPQMIVDGRTFFVGSNSSQALEAIIDAAKASKATMLVATKDVTPTQLALTVTVSNLPAASKGDSASVYLAIAENGLKSSVSRGENAGRKLGHIAVVRRLITIGNINSKETEFSAETTVQLDKRWNPGNLKLVAFVQERMSRRVLGAAIIGLK